MAIVDARIQRTLQLSEAKEKLTKKLSATQDFLVISDTKNPSFESILSNTATFTNLSNTALPQLDDVVDVNGVQLVVTNRTLSWHDESDRVVLMRVQYSGIDLDATVPAPPNDTEEATWRRISARTQQMTKPAKGYASLPDAFNKNPADFLPSLNSAGDPVEGIESDCALVALTYTNPGVINPNFAQLNRYTNQCNVQQFLGGDPYTVRCVGWSGDYDEKTQAWSISVEFLYNPDGWKVSFVDAGFNELTGGRRRAIVDDAGNPISSPIPLDGFGEVLPDGNPLVVVDVYPYGATDLRFIFDDCGIR